ESYYRANVLGTKSVLDAMRTAGVRKILFSSTAATYGFHTEMPLREEAHQLAVESVEPGMGRTYNMGSGTGVTVLEVLRACEEAVGRPITHKVVGRRPGDPGVLIATPEKIVRELGWLPR